MALADGSLIKVKGSPADGKQEVEDVTAEYALQSALDTTNTNVTARVVKTDLSYTGNATGDKTLPAVPTIAEVADVLNQLITDLKAREVI